MKTGISNNPQAAMRSIDTMLRKVTTELEAKIKVIEKKLDDMEQQIMLLQEG